jgi:hypothetical protein
MRPHRSWSKEARIIYTTRRLVAFYKKYPEFIPIALGNNSSNRVVWDGIFRFFFRHFPTKTDTYISYGKKEVRQWWYNEETFDPKWDKFMHEYKANFVFNNIIRPYLNSTKGGV